jgi:predicted phosphoadenosine phosphosulfate sulfurtransferase
MKPLDTDVLSAAKDRLSQVYRTYDEVIVSYSGGKDSTVCLELVIEVARELDKLPIDVLFFDEEVLLPETEEMVMRVRERPEVNLTWVCGQVHYWDASSNEEPHWVTWDPAKRDVWVREPPDFAVWMGEMKYPAPGDAIARLWGPEHGKVAEVLGLRGYESRPRMYGLISSGNFIARGPTPHVDKARPIYDFR